MTKRKRNHHHNRARRRLAATCEDRLNHLANELGLAGVQVLTEQFDFSVGQCDAWLKATLERAVANRRGRIIETIKAVANES